MDLRRWVKRETGCEIKNLDRWKTACTYLENHKLKYIGDVFIGSIVGTYIFERYCGQDESFMSTLRSNIIRRDHLTHGLALPLGIKDLCIVPKNFTTINPSIVEETFEALTGAIAIEFGSEVCTRVIYRWLEKYIDWASLIAFDKNYKQKLLQMLHSQLGVLPDWKWDGRRAELWFRGECVGFGEARVKIDAQQEACRQALQVLIEEGVIFEEIEPKKMGMGMGTGVGMGVGMGGGETCQDADIEECVFIHPQYNAEYNYEQLEFLGDQQLELVVCQYIFNRFPNEDPQFLTVLKTKIVRTKSLAAQARRLGFDKKIKGICDDSVLEDVFEAYIGSLYRHNRERMYEHIMSMLEYHIDWAELISVDDNWKQQLLIWFQSFSTYQPVTIVEDICEGQFHVACFDNLGFILSRAKHEDRQSAEQEAAKKALRCLRQLKIN